MRQRRVLLDNLRFGEGPRWHDGTLWFSDMHDHHVIRVTPDGQASTVVEVTDDTPSGLGWLPDGRMLIVAMESGQLLRLEPDGSLVEHADLSSHARGSLNDMIVNLDGTAYVGDMGTRIQDPSSERLTGQTLRVDPDGTVTQAADDLSSPNGHAVTDDGKTLVIAQSGGAELTAFDVADDGSLSNRRPYAPLSGVGERPGIPDGFCLDDGGAWYADPINTRLVRVAIGGEVTEAIDYTGDMGLPIACVLGGPDRKTLFVCAAAGWKHDDVMATRSGRIDTYQVDIPGTGRP